MLGFGPFQYFSQRPKIYLYTDQKLLEKLGKGHTKTLCRLKQYMGTYNFESRHKKGDEQTSNRWPGRVP
jgi:hypothetical protein